tara:strand:- start:530 stop:796 length:267 start_codon:yes stop_codon:yes gene_type:complete
MKKIKFNSAYSPYNKDQVVTVDAQSYNFYLTAGVASDYDECKCKKESKGCSECDKANKINIEANAEDLKIEVPVKKASVKKVSPRKKK